MHPFLCHSFWETDYTLWKSIHACSRFRFTQKGEQETKSLYVTSKRNKERIQPSCVIILVTDQGMALTSLSVILARETRCCHDSRLAPHIPHQLTLAVTFELTYDTDFNVMRTSESFNYSRFTWISLWDENNCKTKCKTNWKSVDENFFFYGKDCVTRASKAPSSWAVKSQLLWCLLDSVMTLFVTVFDLIPSVTLVVVV